MKQPIGKNEAELIARLQANFLADLDTEAVTKVYDRLTDAMEEIIERHDPKLNEMVVAIGNLVASLCEVSMKDLYATKAKPLGISWERYTRVAISSMMPTLMETIAQRFGGRFGALEVKIEDCETTGQQGNA